MSKVGFEGLRVEASRSRVGQFQGASGWFVRSSLHYFQLRLLSGVIHGLKVDAGVVTDRRENNRGVALAFAGVFHDRRCVGSDSN